MHIRSEGAYDAACTEMQSLFHRELHEQNLSPDESQRLTELADAVIKYEDDPLVYETMLRRPKGTAPRARAERAD